jgi:hypothetical protein
VYAVRWRDVGECAASVVGGGACLDRTEQNNTKRRQRSTAVATVQINIKDDDQRPQY